MDQIRRTRREGRAKPSFGEDRVRGTCGQNATLDKAVTKNPTRFVPDLPGFSCLTKNEIKKDTWDVDKRSSLMVSCLKKQLPATVVWTSKRKTQLSPPTFSAARTAGGRMRSACASLLLFLLLLLSHSAGAETLSQESVGEDVRFINWFHANGGRATKIGLSSFARMGRGIQALGNISSGEEVLRVPASLILSISTLAESRDPVHKAIVRSFGSDSGEDVVIAALLLELSRSDKSRFYEYISVLPRNVPNLSYFSKDSLAELQHAELQRDVLDSQGTLAQRFASFLRNAEAFWPQHGLDIHLTQLTLNDYRWAVSIMDSRGLRFKGKVYLAPFADMFNYAPHPLSRPANSGEFFLEHHKLHRDGHLAIFADRATTLGQQLFEDYGDNKDNIYLQYHGFVPEYNPFRCVVLDAVEMNLLPENSVKMLRAIRFERPPRQCLDSSGDLDEGMIVYHTCAAFTSDEVEHCLGLARPGQRDAPLPWGKLSVECGFKRVQQELSSYLQDSHQSHQSDLTRRTLQAISASMVIHAKQNNWTTTVEEDLIRLDNIPHTPEYEQLRMALRYRLYSKRLLGRWLDGGSGWIDTIGIDGGLGQEWHDYPNRDGELEQRIFNFNRWFADAAPSVNGLVASYLPDYRIGTVATRPIVKGDPYLGVPVSIILSSDAAWSHQVVGTVIQNLSNNYNGARDDFHELLFLLLHEMFITRQRSQYWPYLALLPTTKEMDIPLLWKSDEDVKIRLGPSHIVRSIIDYRNKTRNAFASLSRISILDTFFKSLKSNPWSWANYQWAVAILDSRSIWWASRRHLVPMLDFVNCAEGPPGHAVHSTALDDTGGYALTRAPWSFARGEQVLENYGQPNSIYFMYHGFSLALSPPSPHDCVHHEFSLEERKFDPDEESILKRIFLRGSLAVDVCMKSESLPETIWLFLALQMKKVASLKSRNLLGKRTADAAHALISIIETRLVNYRSFKSPQAASGKFLETEERLLRGIAERLRSDDVDL